MSLPRDGPEWGDPKHPAVTTDGWCRSVPSARWDASDRLGRIRFVRPGVAFGYVGAVGLLFLLVSARPAPARLDVPASARAASFETSRLFSVGRGRAIRRFTLRERSGVILLNRITVPHGVRAIVEATIPGLAGARVTSWLVHNDPSLSCRREGSSDVCRQSEEWCPMPQATRHFRLVKLSGLGGPIRFDYVVAPPPVHD